MSQCPPTPLLQTRVTAPHLSSGMGVLQSSRWFASSHPSPSAPAPLCLSPPDPQTRPRRSRVLVLDRDGLPRHPNSQAKTIQAQPNLDHLQIDGTDCRDTYLY